MKVAIPIFNGRVSPRFDFATKVLVATVDKEKVIDRDTYSLLNLNSMRRNSLLKELEVDVLICGGISDFSMRFLLDRGIEIVAMVSGEVEQIIELLINKKLDAAMTPESLGKSFRRYGGRGKRYAHRRKGFVPK